MADNSDNTSKMEKNYEAAQFRRVRHKKALMRKKRQNIGESGKEAMGLDNMASFDPEMLYVECEKCGSPVIWGEGRATHLLAEAGIDPLELDSFCILLTDGCPVCGLREEYAVRILRSGIKAGLMPVHGHA